MSPFSIEDLIQQFIKEKRFLDDLSEHTIRSYKLALKWFVTLGGDFNKIALNNFVIGLRACLEIRKRSTEIVKLFLR